jgi:hypothetical protein
MVMLDALSRIAKLHGGNDRWSIGYVTATNPFTRAIAARKPEVTPCLQLPQQGIHPRRGILTVPVPRFMPDPGV